METSYRYIEWPKANTSTELTSDETTASKIFSTERTLNPCVSDWSTGTWKRFYNFSNAD